MSKKVDISKVLEVAPVLSPIAEFIDHVEIGEWKDVNKWDRPEKGEAKRLEETEPRLTVWMPLKDINLDLLNRMKNADNTPRVSVKRVDGVIKLIRLPYDNPKTKKRTWSPKVQGFFLSGDEYKQFRDFAPLVVMVLIRMGLIK